MTNEKEIKCIRCESTNLVKDKLGIKGSAWEVTFGSKLFKKRDLLAYLCKDCDSVFLELSKQVT